MSQNHEDEYKNMNTIRKSTLHICENVDFTHDKA